MNMEVHNYTVRQKKRKKTGEKEAFHFSKGFVSSERGTDWAALPDDCLQHVFKFLPDCDRISAIQVCHHWHAVMMHCPSLWRFREFHLTGQPRFKRSEYCSTIGYVQAMGVHLKKLEIHVYPPCSSLVSRRLGITIMDLLTELIRVKAQLQSFSLIGLSLTQYCWSKKLSKSLFDSVMDFLHRGSTKITSLSLVNMRTTVEQGLELLSALTPSESGIPPRCKITHLNLEGFFSSALRVYTNTNVAAVMSNLQDLTDLTLSYSWMSDELLLALHPKRQAKKSDPRRRSRPLKTLSLYCTVHEPHNQLVSSSSWASLVSNCPHLKVKFTVEHIINTERLRRILLPEIPLTEFSMTGFYSHDDDWSGMPLLSELLPQFHLSLQNLSLDMGNCDEVDEQLLELVNVCEHLEQLEVCAFMELSTMERLLQMRLLTRTSLNYIRVTIYSVFDSSEEENRLREIISCYSDLPSKLDFCATICTDC